MVPVALPLFVLISCSRASQPDHPIVNWTHTILCQCFCCPSNETDTKHFQLPFLSLFSLIAPPISNVFWDSSALLHCTALAFSLLAMQDLLFFFCKLFSMEFGSSPFECNSFSSCILRLEVSALLLLHWEKDIVLYKFTWGMTNSRLLNLHLNIHEVVAYDSTATKESKYVGCENQNNELKCTGLSFIKLNNGLLN